MKVDVPAQKISKLNLILETADEIQFLVDVMNCIGGDPELSRRKYAKEFLQAFAEVGIDTNCKPNSLGGYFPEDMDSYNRSIYFKYIV